MASVRLRIDPFDAAAVGFPISLVEGGAETARHVLPAAALSGGEWTVRLPGVAPAGKDLVETLSNVAADARDAHDWAAIGRVLYDWLIPVGPIRTRWMQLLPQVPDLHLEIAADELLPMPWELACSAAPERRPAVINGLSRLATAQPAAAASSPWPLRILIVVGCDQKDEVLLSIADEVQRIRRRFLELCRSVDIHTLVRPTKAELRAHVSGDPPRLGYPPHIFHFAGHGAEDPLSGTPGLRIEAPGDPWTWKRDEIPTDLALWRWAPDFVFLNSCRSGVGRTGTFSVQRSFLDCGAKAVLAMMADVRGDLAGFFAADLYDQCANGATVQEAVREARARLATELKSYGPIDWALPSLTAVEESLTLVKPCKPPELDSFRKCSEFESATLFANCSEERRLFTHWAYPATPPKAVKSVLVLSGPTGSGKSHLLKWSMETWAIGGAAVRYIELHKGVARDFLSIVRQVRDGDSDGTPSLDFLHQALPASAFKRFNWELNNRLATGQPGEWNDAEHPEAVIADAMASISAKGEQPPEEGIAESFVTALKLAAGHLAAQPAPASRRPLILVFDKFGGADNARFVNPKGFEQLLTGVFQAITDDPAAGIKLVFSVTPNEFKDYQLDLLPAASVERLDLPHDYPDSDLVPLAVEMFRFRKEDEITEFAEKLLGFFPPDDLYVGLGRLGRIANFLRDSKDFEKIERMR